MKGLHQYFTKGFFFNFTFPNPHHVPASPGKCFRYVLVSPYVSLPLFGPILFVLFRAGIPAVMTMPETPISENGSFQFRKNKIRFPGNGVVASPTFYAVGLEKGNEAHFR